ncbi:hypothetical protein C8R46DRAFT_1087443, partial [Mycena filopes]
TKLKGFKDALASAPKSILERTILEQARRDGRVAKIFWDAFVSESGAAKFATCRHCGEAYDVAGNTHESCSWHYVEIAAGSLVIDPEVWVDHYESSDGPIDTKENRKDCPEGFFWDCCGLRLDAAGCLRTKHAPLCVLTRNGRVLEPIDSERFTAHFGGTGQYDRHVEARPPTKKRKTAGSKCRMCGETYDPEQNTVRVCHWHDLDAVRRFTGQREGWDSDRDGDRVYRHKEDENNDSDDNDSAETIQWSCCGYGKKEGGGCVVSVHLPPRRSDPKEEDCASIQEEPEQLLYMIIGTETKTDSLEHSSWTEVEASATETDQIMKSESEPAPPFCNPT